MVVHEDYPTEIRYWAGAAVMSEKKKDLLHCVSKKRGGLGAAVNESLVFVRATITYPL